MKYIILIFFFLVSLLNAQTSNNKKEIYLDINYQSTTRDNAAYCVVKDFFNDTITNIKKYYLSKKGAILVENYYVDLAQKKQGKYNSYFKTGTKKEDGVYLNDKKDGIWKFYNSCKKYNDTVYISLISRELSYKNNRKNGRYKEYDYIGSVLGEGQYNNDKLIGLWKWYYPRFRIHSKETYDKKGVLINIKQWEFFGNEKIKDVKPMFDNESRIDYLKNKIQTAIVYNFDIHANKRPMKYVDKIYLKILIDKNGKIHTLKAKGTFELNKIYEERAKQVIDNMSNIEPFYSHNKVIDKKFSFNVSVIPWVVKSLN